LLKERWQKETEKEREREREMTLSGVSFLLHVTVWQTESVNAVCPEINTNVPETNRHTHTHTHTHNSFNTLRKTRDKANNLFSFQTAQPPQRQHRHRGLFQLSDNEGYWLAGRGQSTHTRTTPVQITAVICFYSANEAVRDGLHCQADLWVLLCPDDRGLSGAQLKHRLIFSLNHWFHNPSTKLSETFTKEILLKKLTKYQIVNTGNVNIQSAQIVQRLLVRTTAKKSFTV